MPRVTSLNGGIIGADNTPSPSKKITTFTSNGCFNRTVPTAQVVVVAGGGGGSYGAGNYGMCGRGFRPDMMFAWPNSVVATMSADIGTNVVMELAKNSISKKASAEDLEKLEKDTRALYAEKSDPYFATSRIWDDGIIEPCQTRDVIGLCLSVAATNEPRDDRTSVYRM